MMTISRHKKKKNQVKPFATLELVTINSTYWEGINSTEAWVYTVLKTFYKGNRQKFKAPFNEIKRRSRIKHADTINKAIQGVDSPRVEPVAPSTYFELRSPPFGRRLHSPTGKPVELW